MEMAEILSKILSQSSCLGRSCRGKIKQSRTRALISPNFDFMTFTGNHKGKPRNRAIWANGEAVQDAWRRIGERTNGGQAAELRRMCDKRC